jgi:hypothetical protein
MCGSEETVRQLAPTGRLFRATSAVIYTVLSSSSPTPHDDETGLKFKPLSRRVPFSLDSRGQSAELDGLFRRPIGRRRYGELHLLFSFPDLLCYVDIWVEISANDGGFWFTSQGLRRGSPSCGTHCGRRTRGRWLLPLWPMRLPPSPLREGTFIPLAIFPPSMTVQSGYWCADPQFSRHAWF